MLNINHYYRQRYTFDYINEMYNKIKKKYRSTYLVKDLSSACYFLNFRNKDYFFNSNKALGDFLVPYYFAIIKEEYFNFLKRHFQFNEEIANLFLNT